MTPFVVRSGSDQFSVWAVRPGEGWRARVESGELAAEAKVYERHSGEELRLDSYFADLAQHGRGWQGDRGWEGLGLELAARHDGQGHIALDVTLWDDYAGADNWKARATLALEAGALDGLAREARSVDAH